MEATYNYKVVRQFAIMTVVWGIVGMLVGVILAAQLIWPTLTEALGPLAPYLSYGRIRPLHTNAVIFAFGGSALFATSLYIVQRTCQARLLSDGLASFVFWGWQLVILLAAVTLPMGYHHRQGIRRTGMADRLADRGGLGRLRRAVLRHHHQAQDPAHLCGQLVLRRLHRHHRHSAYRQQRGIAGRRLTKSYSAYAGVHDAMVQWWYGHNAVGFFLTTAFLGMMYYFIPKQAGRPIFSYRLSIVHFWALNFIYMWAGPHHLLYTALPDWAQSLGMVFSLMLIAPSWGGMMNGIMTLSGAWHKLRTDPILKFLITAMSFYGMSTFEGPMMSVKTVNALSHYTEWTVGHVHSGALGWVAMISIGSLYHLIPRLFGREEMFSVKLINTHFWMSTIGVVLYIAALWIAGVAQGLMWRATNSDGTLTYSFAQSVNAMYPFYTIRLIGGGLFFAGMLLMAYNVWKTIAAGKAVNDARIPEAVAA